MLCHVIQVLRLRTSVKEAVSQGLSMWSLHLTTRLLTRHMSSNLFGPSGQVGVKTVCRASDYLMGHIVLLLIY